MAFIIIIIIIIIKKDWQCKAGRGRLTSYQSEDPSPTLPTYRGKEEKGKIVEEPYNVTMLLNHTVGYDFSVIISMTFYQ